MRNKSIDIGGDELLIGERPIPTVGSVASADMVMEVEPVADAYGFKDHAAELAFMEEKVEIFLHESTNPNEEPIVYVGVNGEGVWLKRGMQHTIKRKHMLNLLTARPVHYTTVEGTDRDGAKTVNLRAHTAVKYPFSIQKDTQKGNEWSRQFMIGGR